MENTWFLAALWLGLALIATLLAIWLRLSTALSEIVVGTVAQLVIGAFFGVEMLSAKAPWITFLSGTGAIVLTFLAGAELDPAIFRVKWKEALGVGLIGFFAPFLGCAALAYYVLGWSGPSSWLAGIALSTTSVAVAARLQADLLVLSVARPASEIPDIEDLAREYYEEAFPRLRELATKRGVALQTSVKVGYWSELIVQTAERDQSELIVVGGLRESRFRRWMLGSVHNRVLRHARCPVLVVR